jgi:hypothetical protein
MVAKFLIPSKKSKEGNDDCRRRQNRKMWRIFILKNDVKD